MAAVAVQHRAQGIGELHLHRNVGPDIGAVLLKRRHMVVAPYAGMQRHHQTVITRHPCHFRNKMAAQRRSLHLRSFTFTSRCINALCLSYLERISMSVEVAVVGGDGTVVLEVLATVLQGGDITVVVPGIDPRYLS